LIGGFDLAAQWMGWENVFHCEWNPFGQKVLKHYWPEAISYEDITKTDFTIHRGTIDVLTGGFPCQPYSTAGKRLGKEDERHLWPEMLRAIREIAPRFVVGENVRGLLSWNGGLVFDEVQAELEDCGYEILPFLLPACSVNAPHRRDRIWFVAFKNSGRNGCGNGKYDEQINIGDKRESGSRSQEWFFNEAIRNDATNTESRGLEGQWGFTEDKRFEREVGSIRTNERIGGYIDSDASNTGLQRGELDGTFNEGFRTRESFGSTSELHQIENWEQFPSQPPICNGNDGVSARLDGITLSKWRKESIKAGGNAIVPQVALQIFKAIEKYETYIRNSNRRVLQTSSKRRNKKV